ncbi:MAG: outer membrane beta-barrel protein [Bacteroidia bacterium]|nr:outer membrane beta-barrel protein [Bacteroidia bacterium]MDW8159419.1 outer membrane beta-barrel protein [Bacteroidia bacterium]
MRKLSFSSLFYLFTTILVGSISNLAAQQRYIYWSVGLGVGGTLYSGDLGFSVAPAFGFNVNYHFHPHWLARFSYTQGWYGGTFEFGKGSQAQEIKIRSAIADFSGQIVYELFAVEGLYKYRPLWTPYFFTGLSVFTFNPKGQAAEAWTAEGSPTKSLFSGPGEWVALKPLGTEGQYLLDPDREYPEPYRLTQFSIPFGAGVRYRLNKRMDFRFEVGMRKTFTGYLDDINGNYAPYDLIFQQMGPKAALFADPRRVASARERTLERRASNTGDDWYGFFLFSLSYILDSGDRCPPRFRKAQ